MPGFIFGSVFQKMADVIYENDGPDRGYRNFLQNPDYIQARKKEDALRSELKQVIPTNKENILDNYDDSVADENSVICRHNYDQGFYDGLAIMQILVHLLNGKHIDGEVTRLLDGFFYQHEIEDDGLTEAQIILTKLIETIEERQELDCDITCMVRQH